MSVSKTTSGLGVKNVLYQYAGRHIPSTVASLQSQVRLANLSFQQILLNSFNGYF